MARVNIDILGINELKWTGMGEFNSDDHCIYYFGQNSFRRNGVALIVNKRVRNAFIQFSSVAQSCPTLCNPMNSMKRQKDRTLKNELLRSVGAQYATGEGWRNNSRKNEEMEPEQKQHPVVDVTGNGSKV